MRLFGQSLVDRCAQRSFLPCYITQPYSRTESANYANSVVALTDETRTATSLCSLLIAGYSVQHRNNAVQCIF